MLPPGAVPPGVFPAAPGDGLVGVIVPLGLLVPLDGAVEELPDDGAVLAPEDRLGVELPEELFWLEPELSQAASESAESSAAATSHFLSIIPSPLG